MFQLTLPFNGYLERRAWSDSMSDDANRSLRQLVAYLMNYRQGTDDEDMKLNTDVVFGLPKVLTRLSEISLSLRYRRTESTKSYRDMTVRSRTVCGGKTELHKIRDGHGNLMLICWTTNSIPIEQVLIDLDAIRRHGLLDIQRDEIPNRNKDGKLDGTAFVAIPLDQLKGFDGIVLAHRHRVGDGRDDWIWVI